MKLVSSVWRGFIRYYVGAPLVGAQYNEIGGNTTHPHNSIVAAPLVGAQNGLSYQSA